MKTHFFMSLKISFHYLLTLIKSMTIFKFANNASCEEDKKIRTALIPKCDPPHDFSDFGDDTRTTRLHGKTKEVGVNTERPC